MPRLAFSHQGRTSHSALEGLGPTERYPHRLTLTCPDGLPVGWQARVVLGRFRILARSMKALWRLDDVRVEGAGRVTVVKEPFTEFYGIQASREETRWHHYVFVTVEVAEALAPGSHLVFDLLGRAGGYGTAPLHGFLQLEVSAPDSEAFTQVGRTVLLERYPGEPAQIEVRTKPVPDAEGRASAVLFCTDEQLNPTPCKAGTVRLETQGGLEDVPDTLDWERAERGRLRLRDIRVTGDGPARIEVHDEATGSRAVSGAILPGSINGYGHYFGALHFHTRYSGDGDRGLWQAYEYARDTLNLDVAAAADHVPSRWWGEILAINEAFNEPGRFITMPAWEASTKQGHSNVYLRSPRTNMCPRDAAYDWSAPMAFDGPEEAIIVPHATNVRGHPGVDWASMGRRVRLIEMLQVRGCSETNVAEAEWRIEPRGDGDASVRAALAHGIRAGFIGGTDNHVGYPTRGLQPTGPDERMEYVGLTGFVAPKLTREAIWAAMDGRHTYATSGVPILCHLELNGAIMGSEIAASPGQGLHLTAQLHGTAPVERVQVICNGECVHDQQPRQWDVEVDRVLTAPQSGSAYYYLRLLQADGHRAWTSPVWVDVS
jgi:hypothetical protein